MNRTGRADSPRIQTDGRQTRASGDTARVRSGSRSRRISMAVLVRDLNLQIEDLEQTPDIHGKLRAYYKLLKGYAMRMGHQFILHRKESFLPSRG